MIKTICVCGAGTMGSGIAQLAAQAGFSTIHYDLDPAMLKKSRLSIESNFDKLISKERMSATDKQKCMDRIVLTSELRDCIADLVIEAIVEQQQVKAELFNALAAINFPETIFASNTSSLSITGLAKQIKHPGRVAGMHFFNPAPLMKLVEIVSGEQTEPDTIQTLLAVAKQMGKTPVVCKDAPGFIVNRVARPYYLEAMQLIEQGLTDIKTIDRVMEATGFKMGPFALMDLIGMDINYNVSNIVWEALGKPERLRPSAIQKQKVDAGELGRKTGKGFYDHVQSGK
ncbi:MAG: 3-hydroxybutyryl-CoA dehydrogenase [Chitinophagaceae bacterium]|nr:3-hydroxybutyryl-CoA dehydrogenase [Chitinophagaceae bacterium]